MANPATQRLIGEAVGAGLVILLAFLLRIYLRRAALWPARSQYHGITVGAAKVYDSRSLSLMLEQLREQLRTLQTLDSQKISDGVGSTQAESAKTISFDVAVGSAGDKTGAKAVDNKSTPDSQPKDVTPAPLSERALDLLADQVNLSYDIFNLRLMLERAISDRIMKDDLQRPVSRVQAVVGFPISIDPPAFSTGCAAIVEVELTAAQPLSLIALFPQEESRNASIRSSSRVNVSGSSNAAGVPLNAGYQQGQTVNTLRRETDTVALERPSADPRQVIFAWEFRPTTGSASITPGTRQMLAVISIQEPDSDTSGAEFVEVSVHVRSYWRRFHTLSQTVAASSGWRVLLTRTPTEAPWQRQPDIRALLTHAIDQGLAPKYEDIQWHQVGEQTAVVIVTGKNFFSGTSVVIGGKTLDKPENGLVIKSEQSLQLTVPLSALTHEAVLNGRYGPSIELKMDPGGLNPFQIALGEFLPLSTGQIYVRLSLVSTTNKPLEIDDVKRLPSPLLEINGQFATATLQIFMWPQNNPGVCLCAHVDESFVKVGSGTSVRLTFPFLGKDWSLLFRTYDIRSALCATRMVDGPTTRFRFSGGSFSWGRPWSVFLDRVYTPDINGPLKEIGVDLLELEVPTETADKYDQASLIGYYGSAAVRLPRDSSKAPALQGNAKVIVLEAKSQTTVEIEGTELGSVKQVLLGNTTLPFTSASDGSKITVGLFGDALNLTAGKYEFNLVTDTNESLTLPLFITPGKGS